MATVTLTRQQRDGLHGFLGSHLGRDLSIYVRHNDENAIKETAAILTRCIPVLDQIGWEERGSHERYELTVDAEVRRLIADITPGIQGTIRDDLDYLETGDPEDGLHCLEVDRAALVAANLIAAVAR